jgi:uncharacterized protein (TIGR00251 family)
MSRKFEKKGVTITIKVEPRSSRAGIVGPYGEGLKVKLTSPPVEGKANKELIEVLAKAFNIKKGDIEILSGIRSKNKTVRLNGIEDIENILKNNYWI